MVQLKFVKHDSQNEFYRRPLGAAEAGSSVRLRLKVETESLSAEDKIEVKLRFWQERAGEHIYIMQPDTAALENLYYSADVTMPEKGCLMWYYFVVTINDKVWYYGNNPERLGGIGLTANEPPSMSYQITVYNKGAKTPDWFKHAVMYQIFPDRFYRKGDKIIEKQGAVFHASWQDKPFYFKDPDTKEIIAYDFFGGNLAGIREKLPYLKELGISVVYLNPVFESASNHRYDTGDYHKIDPILGTTEEFAELCAEGKKLGINFILDGVFSHTGEDSKYFNKYGHYDSVGAYQSKESPYYSWYSFHDYPYSYESWWGFNNLPNVQETNPAYMDFIINDKDSVLNHWMQQGISGWRLDVVDELPEQFSQAFYKRLKEINPEAVLIGEVWEDASNKNAYGVSREYLCGQELDSAMNYPFRSMVLDFLLGHADAQQINKRVNSLKENYPKHNYYAMMNLIGSHDRERILTLLGEAPSQENVPAIKQAQYHLDGKHLHLGMQRMKLAVLWQMTFPGVPSVYYGDEIAMQGYRDPYSRCPYDWENGDEEMRQWHKQLIALRNKFPALQTGDLLTVYNEGDVYGYARTIANGRDVFGAEADNDVFVILLNRGQEQKHLSLDIKDLAAGTMVDALGIRPDIKLMRGRMDIDLPPYTGVIYRNKPQAMSSQQERKCGILLHPTSLPSPFGIGDFGPKAYEFVDYLASAGQKIWQILPLNPVGPGNSPYASPSAFAGNILLISLEKLAEDGLLSTKDIEEASCVNTGRVDYDWAKKVKASLLVKACMNFFGKGKAKEKQEFEDFCKKHNYWLRDYALFQVIKAWQGGKCWNEWDAPLVRRDQMELETVEEEMALEIQRVKFEQYIFWKQWQELKAYANGKGIKILGDMPIFVSLDSADVWANQQLFKLDQNGKPYKVAGVPPDYFSKTGQLWGNPQYNWEVMRKDGYGWWMKRFRNILTQVDMVRVDHFRGFEAFWEIDGDAETAIDGVWRPGPGKAFFELLHETLGDVNLVAEDLGIITDEVENLRQQCNLPGMKVLQFELHFNDYKRISAVEPEDCLVYTGTHDNNTLLGWLQEDASRGEVEAIARMLRDVDADEKKLCQLLVEHVYASAARIAITPLQDVLALDSSHRMNLPGTAKGNWAWRMESSQLLSPEKAKWLKALSGKYHR